MKLIDKSALAAEIKARINDIEVAQKAGLIRNREADMKITLFKSVLSLLDSFEVKEVNLEDEIEKEYDRRCKIKCNMLVILNEYQFSELAKHFFELGMAVSNPVTAADRGMEEEIIINLKRVEQDYHIDLTKEMEWLRNKAQKGE